VNIPVLVLVVADFGLIGALPRVFFKARLVQPGLVADPRCRFWCCSIFLVVGRDPRLALVGRQRARPPRC